MNFNDYLAIIPARKGSKGLKNKNIKLFNGKPLIYYPIKAAMKSKFIKKIVVSTDSKEIAQISKKYGAEIPFLRPKKLSGDNVDSYSVVEHCIKFLKKKNFTFKNFILLEPTSPLTTYSDIDKAIIKLNKNTSAKSIVGISKTEQQHPKFSINYNKNSFIKPYFMKNFKTIRRQEINNVYFFDGSLYVSDVDYYLKKKTFYHKYTLGYEMPKWKSFEVDDKVDFLIMENIMKNKKKFI